MSDTDDGQLLPRTGTIDTQFGSYDMAAWSGQNTSGIRALCDKVLVLPDQAMTMAGSIIITDTSQESITAAATTGILVSVGPQAFAYDSDRLVHWEGERPQPGSRVYFQKYAGQEHMGRDGQMYRVMRDKDIAAMDEPVEEMTP
jgi:co-chaperonin GroES (HSP10)